MSPTRLISKIGLSALIILLGVVAALWAGETPGLAVTDLPDTPVRALAAGQQQALYAGLTNGSWPASLYRSQDNGRTWEAVAPELNVPISALTISPADPSKLYAGTGGGSLFKTSSLWSSDDGGQTWRRLVAPLPASPDGLLPAVTAMVIDPNRPDLLYVGTGGHGVYRYDLARNGYELLAGFTLREAEVKDVVVGPEGRVYALTQQGLFVTADDTWQALDAAPEAAVTLAIAPSEPNRLYLGTASSGAYRSDDAGGSWEWIGRDLAPAQGAAPRVTALAVDRNDPHRVAVAVARTVAGKPVPAGVYESQDGGQSWTPLTGPNELADELIYADGTVYAATANGLARYNAPAGCSLAWPWFESESTPSGLQLLIVVLAVALAALVLLNWEKWLSEQNSLFDRE